MTYNKLSTAEIITLLESRKNISDVAIEMLTILLEMREDDVLKMSIQKGLSRLTHWLTIKLNNPKVSSGISSLDLLRVNDKEEELSSTEEETNTFTIIGDKRFRDNITMADWRNAERISISSNKQKLFSLYLIASCCTDGFPTGRNMFVNEEISEHILDGMNEFNMKQKRNKDISLDLMSSFEFLTIGTTKRLKISDSFFLPKFH